jgi:DNA repair exonuclease SbcCD ATPase subunit
MISDKKKPKSPSSPYFINTESSGSPYKQTHDSDMEYTHSFTEFDELERCNTNQSYIKDFEHSFDRKTSYQNGMNYKTNHSTKERRAQSNNFCNTCVEYLEEIENIKNHQKNIHHSRLNTERALKKYDNLLRMKENRLKQQELTFESEKEFLEKEKIFIELEKSKIQKNFIEIQTEKEFLFLEKNKISYEVEEVNKKKVELIVMTEEVELKIEQLKEREQIFEEYKDKILSDKDKKIQSLMRELQSYKAQVPNSDLIELSFHDALSEKKKSLKAKKQELKVLAVELNELKSTLEKQNKENSELFNTKMNALIESERKLVEEKISMEDTQHKMDEALESIDDLKAALASQEQNLEREKKLLQDTYQQKHAEMQELYKIAEEKIKFYENIFCGSFNTESDSNKLINEIEYLNNKIKILETYREETESINSQLTQKLSLVNFDKKSLKKKVSELEKIISLDEESLKKEIKDFYAKYADLEREKLELNGEISSLSQKNSILALKVQELESQNTELMKDLKSTKESYSSLQSKVLSIEETKNLSNSFDIGQDDIQKLYDELQCKLNQFKSKEKELSGLENFLLKEKQSIESAAEFIKTINLELTVQRKKLDEEKEALEKKELIINDLEKKVYEKRKSFIDGENRLQATNAKIFDRNQGQRKLTSVLARNSDIFDSPEWC